jgi:hypothetical protein
MNDEVWKTFGEQAVRIISASSVGNAHLTKLLINCNNLQIEIDGSYIDKLLCDASSIESMTNSNHTLKRISFGYQIRHVHSTFARDCLKLNENEDKAKVIRHKILRFYFVGKFDLSPFVGMPLSVLPEVIDQIEGHEKQSAMYRFLRCIPELCDVHYRTGTIRRHLVEPLAPRRKSVFGRLRTFAQLGRAPARPESKIDLQKSKPERVSS